MALRQGSECFAKWTHVENGQVVSRRLHRIVLQTPSGDLRAITGDRLPDSLQTWSGHAFRGVSLARTLLSPPPVGQRVLGQAPRLAGSKGWFLPREARRRLETLQEALACSTRLDHIENGPPMHREIRRVELQVRDRLYAFTGKQLPEYIGICTGQGFKDNHVATILLSRESELEADQELSAAMCESAAWPQLRDVLHVALGLLGFLMIRFFLNVIIDLA
ncbi:MAG: hypothetical protein ACYC4U_09185 [Pirellulaceae bacterium]